MELLGGANWWLPRWLDRLLPEVDVEGAEPAIITEPEPAATATWHLPGRAFKKVPGGGTRLF